MSQCAERRKALPREAARRRVGWVLGSSERSRNLPGRYNTFITGRGLGHYLYKTSKMVCVPPRGVTVHFISIYSYNQCSRLNTRISPTRRHRPTRTQLYARDIDISSCDLHKHGTVGSKTKAYTERAQRPADVFEE